MQPVVWDGRGVVRFRQNDIVEFLLWFASWRGMTLNELHGMPNVIGVEVPEFSADDWDQFNQLTGYSVSGCPLQNKRLQARADRAAEKLPEETGADRARPFYSPEYPLPSQRLTTPPEDQIAALRRQLAAARDAIADLKAKARAAGIEVREIGS